MDPFLNWGDRKTHYRFGYWVDSYRHYRNRVGLERIKAFFRATYYEIKHKEPWA